MQEIVLSAVALRVIDGKLQIVHNRTGIVTEMSAGRLESWAVAQLRRELLPVNMPLKAA